MLFSHFGKAHSIRDISYGLRSITGNANHPGILEKIPSRSSLSYINEHRNRQMFRALYFRLKEYYQKEEKHLNRKSFHGVKRKIYVPDSRVITLCLKVFNRATYRNEKGGIKLHTLPDYDGCLPWYIFMTRGLQADVKHAQYMIIPRKSVVEMDRGYQFFKMYWGWANRDVCFVTRLKDNIKFSSIKELPLPEGKYENILKDQLLLFATGGLIYGIFKFSHFLFVLYTF